MSETPSPAAGRSTYRAWPHCPTRRPPPNSATPQQPRSPSPTPGRCARRTTPPALPVRARAPAHPLDPADPAPPPAAAPRRPRRCRTAPRPVDALCTTWRRLTCRHSPAGPPLRRARSRRSFAVGQAGQRVSSTSAPVPVPRHATQTDTHRPNSQRCHPSRLTANGCDSPDDPLPTLAAAPPANVSRRRDGCRPGSPPPSASWAPATAPAAYEWLPPPGHSQARPGRRQPAGLPLGDR